MKCPNCGNARLRFYTERNFDEVCICKKCGCSFNITPTKKIYDIMIPEIATWNDFTNPPGKGFILHFFRSRKILTLYQIVNDYKYDDWKIERVNGDKWSYFMLPAEMRKDGEK